MRLGDLDKVKAEMQEYVFPITTNNLMGAADAYYRILHLLDNVPTIDAIPIPCRIGQVVYGIRNYKGISSVQKGFVSEMFFTKDMKLMIVVKHVCRGEWLEKVFPTFESAEAAMRKVGD